MFDEREEVAVVKGGGERGMRISVNVRVRSTGG